MDTKSGIYCIENLVNGKKYIGQTVDLKNRKMEHFRRFNKNEHGNPHLQNSYNKYGEENFYFYVIEYCEKEDLSEKEKQYIRIFNTFNNGYNMTLGGEGGLLGYRHSEESKEKMSKNHADLSGENHPLWGKHRSEEIKRKMSENHADFSGENNPLWGKHHSKETKEKMSENHADFSGEKSSVSKLTKDQVFEILDLYYNKKEMQKDIAKKYRVGDGAISRICRGKRWKDCYQEFMEMHPNCLDFCNKKNYNIRLTEKQVPEILDLYYNKKEKQKDIAKRYGVANNTISNICCGKTWKSCYKEFMESQGR